MCPFIVLGNDPEASVPEQSNIVLVRSYNCVLEHIPTSQQQNGRFEIRYVSDWFCDFHVAIMRCL